MGEDRAGILVGSFAVADVEMTERRRARRFPSATGVAAMLAIGLSVQPAAAYRPFDGTDAAVGDVHEVEVELQPFGYQRMGSQSSAVAPFVVYNYGFAERWELVLQTEMLTPITGGGQPSIADAGVFLKYVILPGVLQGQSGVSIETEF